MCNKSDELFGSNTVKKCIYLIMLIMSVKKLFAAAVAVIMASMTIEARQSLVDDHIDSMVMSRKIITIDGQPSRSQAYMDSIYELIKGFYYDQFRHFQDPDAPYFLFMSKDAQLAMGIGGCVRMRGYYDWGGAIPASGFAPYLIPMDPEPTKMRNFDTTPAGTCLFFRVIGRNKTLGYYQLYIEANFNGYNSRGFELKKAYALINDFTIGYANSTFSDPAATPPTVDAQGPNNKISPTAVLVRWMPKVKDHWTFALSGETPAPQIGADGQYAAKCNKWMPDWAAFAQYEWQRGQHVRVAGILRTLSYRNLVKEQNHNIAGWGVQLSSVAHPLPQLTTYLNVSYGHGYESLGGDLLIGNYDLVADTSEPGKLYAPAAYGWSVGLQYNFTHSIFASVTASQSRYCPKGTVAPQEYRHGEFYAVNAFWNLTPRMQVGVEFDLGCRMDFSGESRWARRIGAMAQFSF